MIGGLRYCDAGDDAIGLSIMHRMNAKARVTLAFFFLSLKEWRVMACLFARLKIPGWRGDIILMSIYRDV
mgnify:CR=1 FL=1